MRLRQQTGSGDLLSGARLALPIGKVAGRIEPVVRGHVARAAREDERKGVVEELLERVCLKIADLRVALRRDRRQVEPPAPSDPFARVAVRFENAGIAPVTTRAAAAAIAQAELSAEAARVVTLRERLWERIESLVPSAYVIGHRYRRLPGHLCLGFQGLEGEAIKLLLALDEAGIMVSTGSACSAHHAGEPSHVLQAMGFDPIRSRGSLRVTFGRFTTEDEIDGFAQVLPRAVASLRPLVTHRQPATNHAQG